jgi:hypothetical protein
MKQTGERQRTWKMKWREKEGNTLGTILTVEMSIAAGGSFKMEERPCGGEIFIGLEKALILF